MELRELEGMEATIQNAEAELATLQAQMSDPATMSDRHRMTEVCASAEAAQQKVQGLYDRWQELDGRR